MDLGPHTGGERMLQCKRRHFGLFAPNPPTASSTAVLKTTENKEILSGVSRNSALGHGISGSYAFRIHARKQT
jgi:hypothetical protein